MADKKNISGWGLFPMKKAWHKKVSTKEELTPFLDAQDSINIRGNGRSYGDASNYEQSLEATAFKKIHDLNPETGILHCESGLLLSEILEYCIPKGFFLPVTPGTKFVSLAGALAADIHGKNHHVDGNISSWVEGFTLVLASGETVFCSSTEHSDLFWSTMGGMGLTGFIQDVFLRLKPVETAYIKLKAIKCRSLEEVIEQMNRTTEYTYSVAWIDCLKKGKQLGRSVLYLGEHANLSDLKPKLQKSPLKLHKAGKLSIPFFFPAFVLNKLSVRIFNWLYYNKQLVKEKDAVVHYDPYYYPLDGIHHWNKIYGRKGFVQYQFVLPPEHAAEGMRIILDKIAASGTASFLSVLKMFGPERSKNYLAFPMAGLNLALDIKLNSKTHQLLDELDELVLNMGGRVYLAKDARMSAETFKNSYPDLPDFKEILSKHNPKGVFNSDLALRLKLLEKEAPHTQSKRFMKNVLILGANSDMAQACAKLFAEKGYALTLASRNMETMQTWSAHISGDKELIYFDARDLESHKTFYQNLSQKPNVVILAFGVLPDEDKARQDLNETLSSIQTNYTGAVSILNVIAEDFKQRKEGSILGISSVAGDRGRGSNYIYGSAKAGFTAYLSGLRNHCIKHGVHVSTIKPGFVKTKMIGDLKTPGPLTAMPEDVAKACYKAYLRKKSVVYTKAVWRPIMWVIKHVPEFIFKKLSL